MNNDSDKTGKVEIEFNDTIVRYFMIASIFWGVIGMAAGVLIALQLGKYIFNFDTSWLTFGRLRPLHTNAAIFAFVGNMMFSGIYYSLQRLVKARLPSNFLAWVHFWGWQAIIVAAAITLPLGLSRGKEYAELIWPINIAVVVMWVIFGVNFFWTLARRNERSLYVAIWFYISTIITVAMLYIVNHLQIPTSFLHAYPIFGGVQDALVQWWYGHNAVAFFLTTPILGIMYYFMPKAADRPVYSYRLSVVHFWSLVFIYIWAGPHHLLNTALPHWLQTLGMVFSLMLWAPSWGGMLNGLLTLRGAWNKLRTDPVLKFFAAGVTFYGMATFEGPLLSIKSVNLLSHYTDWTIGHVHSGTLGWNGFMAAGMFYWLAPRLWGTKLYSIRLADIHFWIGLIGILFYVSAMWVSGITQGMMLNGITEEGVLQYSFIEAIENTSMLTWMRALGGAMYLVGFILLAFNIYKTVRSGCPCNGSIQISASEPSHRPLKAIEAFLNAPVLYSFFGLLCIAIWFFCDGVAGWAGMIVAIVIVLTAILHWEIQGRRWGEWYDRLLEHATAFTVLTLISVLVGGMVQILPTVMTDRSGGVDGIRQIPYTPLELAGRDIYVREGCYNCHSQMVRPILSEYLRYGENSKLGESIYDYPFQWGSKRTGPDLHRVGGKYSNSWHFEHMKDPRKVSPSSRMPNYPWLFENETDLDALPSKIHVQKILGVPYADMSAEHIKAEALAQARKITEDLRSQKLNVSEKKEIVALIAYLQKLGKSEKVSPKDKKAVATK